MGSDKLIMPINGVMNITIPILFYGAVIICVALAECGLRIVRLRWHRHVEKKEILFVITQQI